MDGRWSRYGVRTGKFMNTQEHEVRDLNEPTNYKVALLNLESELLGANGSSRRRPIWMGMYTPLKLVLWQKVMLKPTIELIGLNQSANLEKNLKEFKMENFKNGNIPMQKRPNLSKTQVRCTRPGVAFAQNLTSRFQQNSGECDWTVVKNILKYLRNTKDMFLVYGENLEKELKVTCYTDVGFDTDKDDRKS
ncbi:hypothetical protein Tco_1334798 [Tanacetum coccineum]